MEEKPVGIKQVSEREIWIGDNKFYLDEDNIINVIGLKAPDEKKVLIEIDTILKLANLTEGKVNLIIDINISGTPSKAVRNEIQKLMEQDKFGRIAIVGATPVARVIGAFILGLSKKKDFRILKTKEEALAWLK